MNSTSIERDIPIIFSGPMVRALLEGRKTMTRRIFKRDREPPPQWDGRYGFSVLTPDRHVELRGVDPERGPLSRFMKLKYAKGDRLWVRETWCPANSDNGPVLLTRADTGRRYLVDESYPVNYGKFPAGRRAWSAWAGDVESETETKAWRPSIFMPRWASRLTLIVTGTKVERLQDIALQDVTSEGCEVRQMWLFGADATERQKIGASVFENLWCEIHGPESWRSNPEVVAISFLVIKANIDTPAVRIAA